MHLFVLHEADLVTVQAAETAERELHYRFQDFHLRGEWFNLKPDDLPRIKQAVHEALLMSYAPTDWSLSRKTAEEFTPELCRMLRMALALSEKQLATKAGIAESTVQYFESRSSSPTQSTIEALREAFKAEGVEFIAQGPGKRYKALL